MSRCFVNAKTKSSSTQQTTPVSCQSSGPPSYSRQGYCSQPPRSARFEEYVPSDDMDMHAQRLADLDTNAGPDFEELPYYLVSVLYVPQKVLQTNKIDFKQAKRRLMNRCGGTVNQNDFPCSNSFIPAGASGAPVNSDYQMRTPPRRPPTNDMLNGYYSRTRPVCTYPSTMPRSYEEYIRTNFPQTGQQQLYCVSAAQKSSPPSPPSPSPPPSPPPSPSPPLCRRVPPCYYTEPKPEPDSNAKYYYNREFVDRPSGTSVGRETLLQAAAPINEVIVEKASSSSAAVVEEESITVSSVTSPVCGQMYSSYDVEKVEDSLRNIPQIYSSYGVERAAEPAEYEQQQVKENQLTVTEEKYGGEASRSSVRSQERRCPNERCLAKEKISSKQFTVQYADNSDQPLIQDGRPPFQDDQRIYQVADERIDCVAAQQKPQLPRIYIEEPDGNIRPGSDCECKVTYQRHPPGMNTDASSMTSDTVHTSEMRLEESYTCCPCLKDNSHHRWRTTVEVRRRFSDAMSESSPKHTNKNDSNPSPDSGIKPRNSQIHWSNIYISKSLTDIADTNSEHPTSAKHQSRSLNPSSRASEGEGKEPKLDLSATSVSERPYGNLSPRVSSSTRSPTRHPNHLKEVSEDENSPCDGTDGTTEADEDDTTRRPHSVPNRRDSQPEGVSAETQTMQDELKTSHAKPRRLSKTPRLSFSSRHRGCSVCSVGDGSDATTDNSAKKLNESSDSIHRRSRRRSSLMSSTYSFSKKRPSVV